MPDWFDLVLFSVIAVFAVFGYRLGFLAGLLSLSGFVFGAAAGTRAAPGISRMLVSAGPGRELVAIFIAFLAAVSGALLASVLTSLLRWLSRRPAGITDSVLGAALNVVFVLVVAMVIPSLAGGGRPGLLDRQAGRSLILRAMSQVIPRTLVDSVHVSMASRLAEVSGLDPADLPPPSPAVLDSRAATLARLAVVKVQVFARSCSASLLDTHGSGFVIGTDHVLTNAHVVAGLTRPAVVTLADGQAYQARVVLYDWRHDLAVLYVPGLRARVLHFSGPASYGARAIVAGFPLSDGLTLAPVTVGTSFSAITGTSASAGSDLQVYPIRGDVRAGDSGSPLMAPDGSVYGIVFARSASEPQAGWAIADGSDVARDFKAGRLATASVPAAAHVSC